MNRSKIEGFATKARNLLKSQIAARIELLRKSDSSSVIIENKDALSALKKKIAEKGFESVIDEVAYTWFNRLCALRYMDAHGFNRPLVVTPLEGEVLPEILSDAMVGNIETGILSKANEERINKLLLGEIRSNNAQSEIYRILLVSKCNALNSDIPMLFERISDYTDLLLPEDLLSKDAVIPMMCEALTDENCETVEVIGWLYQYYIAERKDEVFAGFKKGKKATSKEIPAATQLFTPEWIVRYLVENSLGRLWMLNHPDSKLINSMSYYIKPSEIEPDYIRINTPEEIKICDPCCGSGHMLTYCFDILFEIYSELGYTSKDAVEHIIKDNLYGIELDNRAGQLSYFALMMKARERSRRFFSQHIEPNICVLNNVTFEDDELPEAIELFSTKGDMLIEKLLKQYEHADTLGSLITPILTDCKDLVPQERTGSLFDTSVTLLPRVKEVLKYGEYLSQKYHVVVTNPPYMDPSNSSEAVLQNFAKKEYPNSKTDMGTMFIERNLEMAVKNGYVAMVTLQSWMFLSSFEKLRRNIIDRRTILSMAHIGARGFDAISGEVVSTTAFVLSNTFNENYRGIYFRLVNGENERAKANLFKDAIITQDYHYYFRVSVEQFNKITGTPISYWATPRIYYLFENYSPLDKEISLREGIHTGCNERFLRLWHEISDIKFITTAMSYFDIDSSHKRWVPYSKGGGYRKWYGLNTRVIGFDKEYRDEMAKLSGHVRPSQNLYFKEGCSWSAISSGRFGLRYQPPGFLFDSKGQVAIGSNWRNVIAILNTNTYQNLADLIMPTLDYKCGDVKTLPYCPIENESALTLVSKCIYLSKKDWDSFETSWDFKRSPLLKPLTEPSYEEQVEMDNVTFAVMGYLGSDKADEVFYVNRPIRKACPLECAYVRYQAQANEDFYHLKMNEEELNRIFIDIYGLGDELEPEEDEKMVSIHRIYDSEDEIPLEEKEDENGRKKKVRMPYAMTKMDVIEDFISYAVGCMFGRYSLDVEGLAYAGGEWNGSKYSSFIPDSDNVIPVIADEWFSDDITFRFREFVKVTFGEESLSENMKFIEDSIGMSIRSYFVKEFYKHHLKIYKKRPIYWMFSSPKGYFNALVYLHRYNENTSNVVLRYLRQQRQKLSSEISALEREDNSRNAKTIVNYKKIAEDLDDYERILYPIAMENISLDLDDGVKVNYAKLGKALKKVPGLETNE